MTLTVGVIGAGQLARMMIPPAVELGLELRVLAASEGESARVAVTALGSHTDAEAVAAFARDVDVVTFDHEHVPQPVLRALEAEGVAVRPGADALRFAQDKLVMRRRLTELGLPVPEWAEVATQEELAAFLAEHGGAAVVKTPRGGYDGKGVRLVRDAAEAADWFGDGPLLAEELVEFRRELAALVARRPNGDIAAWPVVETVQRDGVCVEVLAPAPDADERLQEVATQVAATIARELDVTGVLAVELFETTDQRILVNELAMRPHNSGHWTIDGAATSQFEQHLRAVLDLPLGPTVPRAPWTVMINVLGGVDDVTARFEAAWSDQPDVKLHFYGKGARPGRKVGHVTAWGDDLEETVFRARAAAAFFQG
ncbi:MAG TPA: 5-(carboxyamino)imidazole ribonucleotide synthase [Rhodoglobus sp.]|nr:5-(carboxyamino)imidazole ribonucleotide synthase [Rhodoglobus sp.]